MTREFNGQYEFDPNGINEIISEKGDTFLALREVRWRSDKEFKLDLRHYRSDEFGDKTLKGCSFFDEDADELTRILLQHGLGDDIEIANTITEFRPGLCRELQEIFKEGADLSEVDSRYNRLLYKNMDDDMESIEEGGSLDDYYDPRRMAI